MLGRGGRLLAGLELRIAGSRNRSEDLLLELVELRACRAMLALQLEMLADGVVEDSHEPEGLQMPAYAGRRERGLASPLASVPLRPRGPTGSQVSSGLRSDTALGAIAQLEERLDRTQEVAGSSPASSIAAYSESTAAPD